MSKTMNYYVAYSKPYKGARTAMFNGYATSKERFIGLCEEESFGLDGLEVELVTENVTDEMGKPYHREGVHRDLGTI